MNLTLESRRHCSTAVAIWEQAERSDDGSRRTGFFVVAGLAKFGQQRPVEVSEGAFEVAEVKRHDVEDCVTGGAEQTGFAAI